MLQKMWLWLVRSSADPEQLSATIKGLAAFVPAVVVMFTLLHINVGSDLLLAYIDKLALLATYIAGGVSAAYAFVGFCRKVYTTIMGTNQVVLGFAKE